MNQDVYTPDLTTTQRSRTGLFCGYRNQAGRRFRPEDVPAREIGSRQARRASGTVRPNGEFSLGWVAKGQESTGDAFSWGVSPSVAPSWDLSEWPSGVNPWRCDPKSPWLVSASKSTRPSTYGRKGITRKGKQVVRSGCCLLQRKYGRRRLSFLTLTLPELDSDSLRVIAESWGAIVNRLAQWLCRKLERSGLPKSIVLVTECQPRRAENGSLGCLHVHAVFVGRLRTSSAWVVNPREIRSFWLDELSRRVGYKVESESCEELRMVRKSAEGYLGKYMSKGAESAALVAAKHGWECLPRQWWTATKKVKDAVKKSTFKGEEIGHFLEFLIDSYFQHKDPFPGMLMAHHIDLDGVPFLVGFSGRFDAETARYVLGALGYSTATVDI